MAQVGVTEAARLSGKGRQTIYRAIEAGTLSATRDAHGHTMIDIAELERVYGPLQSPEASQGTLNGALAGDSHQAVLEERVRQLEARLGDRERELDEAREERGRLLSLVENQARALMDLRARSTVGVLGSVRRWLLG